MSCGFLCVAYASGVVREATRPAVERRLAGRGDALRPDSDLGLPPGRHDACRRGDGRLDRARGSGGQGRHAPGRRRVPACGRARRSSRRQDKVITSGDVHRHPASRRCASRAARAGRSSPSRGRMATNALAEAVFRPAGGAWPDPATIPPTALSAPGADIGLGDGPSLTMDGLGNAVATWTRGSVIQAAAFDAAPPAFTAVNVPATGTTGQPVAASATTLDTWSALGAGSRAGTSVTASSPPARRSPMSTPRRGRTP